MAAEEAPPAYAEVSVRKVPTSTSMTSAPPCTGSSRNSTAWVKGRPIQAIPSTVIAIERVTPSRGPRTRANANMSGNVATPTSTIWN